MNLIIKIKHRLEQCFQTSKSEKLLGLFLMKFQQNKQKDIKYNDFFRSIYLNKNCYNHQIIQFYDMCKHKKKDSIIKEIVSQNLQLHINHIIVILMPKQTCRTCHTVLTYLQVSKGFYKCQHCFNGTNKCAFPNCNQPIRRKQYRCHNLECERKLQEFERQKNRRNQTNQFFPFNIYSPRGNRNENPERTLYSSRSYQQFETIRQVGFFKEQRLLKFTECEKCFQTLSNPRYNLCYECYTRQSFFKNHTEKFMKLSRPDIPTIKNRLEKALVIYSIFENGVIYILPTEILRQNLESEVEDELCAHSKIEFLIQKLMIVEVDQMDELETNMSNYQKYPNIKKQFDEFEYYCFNLFKKKQIKQIDERLEVDLFDEKINNDYRNNVNSIPIERIGIILVKTNQNTNKLCIKIRFTPEFKQMFQSYHNYRFTRGCKNKSHQIKKRKKEIPLKQFCYKNKFAFGIVVIKDDKKNKSRYKFFSNLSRKNTFVLFDPSQKYFTILLSLNFRFRIRITIEREKSSLENIEYDQKKGDFYFFLKKPPKFQARYFNQNVAYNQVVSPDIWLTMDNLILKHGDQGDLKNNHLFTALFSQNIVLYFEMPYHNLDESHQAQYLIKKEIKTSFHNFVQIRQQINFTQLYVDRISLMKSFIQKCQLDHNQKIKYWKMYHYIKLDCLLAVQLKTIQNIKSLINQERYDWNQTNNPMSFQYIEEIYDKIHNYKLYLSVKKRKMLQKTKAKKKKESRMKIIPIFNVAFAPTGIKYRGYTNEFQCRILRKFDPQLLIKGTFCQQDGSKIITNRNYSDASYLIQKRFKEYLGGFTLLGVRYVPLGWSNSQIKRNQLWFVNADSRFYRQGYSIRQDIYNFLGDFSKIDNPAKKASRIGQSFSASVRYLQAQNIEKPVEIQDSKTQIFKIQDNYKQYVYSDGIGMLSQNILNNIRKQLKLSDDVCAIQCRYLGLKGVLSLGIHSQNHNKIYVPKSMIKYECQWNDQTGKHFDILNWNKYCPGFINTQIILLLLALGIELQVILDKITSILRQQLYNHQLNIQTIIHYYKTHLDHSPTNEDSLFQLIYYLHTSQENKILKTETFFSEIIDKIKRQISIKAFAKMRVRVKQSARLMGILDTYEVLEENQVYCTIQKNKGAQKKNIDSQVFMTKNPCLHPADIRKVKCVSSEEISKRLVQKGINPEKFNQYINVIVFNQKGKYPLPAQISGGDLDGDYYFICWDKDLIPEEIEPPHLYDSAIVQDKQLINNYQRKFKQKMEDRGQQKIIQSDYYQYCMKMIKDQKQTQKKKYKDKQLKKKQQVKVESTIKQQSSQTFQKVSQKTENGQQIKNIKLYQHQNQVMNDNLIQFFIFYMEKSILGLITKYHVLWAENQRDGAKSKICKEITKYHSVELDFGKKGKQNKPFPQSLVPPKQWQFYKKKSWQKRRSTCLGQIYHQIIEMHKQNSRNQKIKPILSQNWTVSYKAFNSYIYTDEEIQEAIEILVDYKKDVERILYNHNKVKSSQFILYHGRDQEYITDSIKLRQDYRNQFFDNQDQQQFYQSISLEELIQAKTKFNENIYKKAYLWYIISHSTVFSRQNDPSRHYFNQHFKMIIQKAKNAINNVEKVKSRFRIGGAQNDDSDMLAEKKDFENVFGLTWHTVPKIIITMIKDSETKQ